LDKTIKDQFLNRIDQDQIIILVRRGFSYGPAFPALCPATDGAAFVNDFLTLEEHSVHTGNA
jgi:hypothetical protein